MQQIRHSPPFLHATEIENNKFHIFSIFGRGEILVERFLRGQASWGKFRGKILEIQPVM